MSNKKHYAAALSTVTGLCFLAFYFVPNGHFGLMVAVNMIAQFCAGPVASDRPRFGQSSLFLVGGTGRLRHPDSASCGKISRIDGC